MIALTVMSMPRKRCKSRAGTWVTRSNHFKGVTPAVAQPNRRAVPGGLIAFPLFAAARCDPKPSSEQENAGDEVHPGRFAEEHGAEHEGGDGAKRKEDGDTRGRGVAECPEPKDVADPAARPDEDNRQPAAGREVGRGLKEALSDAGRDGERGNGGEHGNGPHR